MTDLSTYSAEALVDAVIRLTHMIDTAKLARDGVKVAERREQRDLARAELLRRCEPAEPRRVRSHICVEGCRPNAHIAFVGRRAADAAEKPTDVIDGRY